MFKNVPVRLETTLAGDKLILETGLLATQADATVLATHGQTTVMATVVVGKKSQADYFPLQVIYEEKLYASGKIKGSRFIKREGKPSDNAVLTGRMVDRSIRSLFDKQTRSEVQVIITVLSLDEVHQPDTLAVIAASAALKLAIQDFQGPVSCLRVGRQAIDLESCLLQKLESSSNIEISEITNYLQDLAGVLDLKNPADKQTAKTILAKLKIREAGLVEVFKQAYKEAQGLDKSELMKNLETKYDLQSKFILNPTYTQADNSELDLVISGDGKNIMMLEAGANILPENQIAEALDLAEDELSRLTSFQAEFVQVATEKLADTDLAIQPKTLLTKEFSPKSLDYWQYFAQDLEALLYSPKPKQAKSEELSEFISLHREILENLSLTVDKLVAKDPTLDYESLKIQTLEILDNLESSYDQEEKIVAPFALGLCQSTGDLKELVNSIDTGLEKFIQQLMKENILKLGKRFDGRDLSTTRQITAQVEVLPRTHGSSLFQRGETQVLNILTLGTQREAQILDDMEDFTETTKRYLHHYNFPSYSVGETGRYGAPGRREIGHGALAEKALLPVLPNQTEFPYTMRLVSECLGSNGSTSMASTCASCLSLLQGGVPIKDLVAGVAMGLVLDSKTEEFRVLTDIQGIEDHYGDMDFKITGTETGITAIQLDNKVAGLTTNILKQAITQSREARLHILNIMKEVISEPRKEISKFAPIVLQTQIPVNKIPDVIGPSGKIIKSMIAQYGVEIEIQDEGGQTYIYGTNKEQAQKALAQIQSITKEYEAGEIVDGKVVRIESYGAFVRLENSSKDGMVHISEIMDKRVENINDHLKIGQELKVKILEVKEDGKINLSLKF